MPRDVSEAARWCHDASFTPQVGAITLINASRPLYAPVRLRAGRSQVWLRLAAGGVTTNAKNVPIPLLRREVTAPPPDKVRDHKVSFIGPVQGAERQVGQSAQSPCIPILCACCLVPCIGNGHVVAWPCDFRLLLPCVRLRNCWIYVPTAGFWRSIFVKLALGTAAGWRKARQGSDKVKSEGEQVAALIVDSEAEPNAALVTGTVQQL